MRWLLWVGLIIASPAWAGELVLAVAPFDAHTAAAEVQPLGLGLADMLVTDLGRAASVRIVERQRLNDVLGELKLQQGAFIDPKTAAQVGKGVGAAVLVVGALTTSGKTMRLDARVVDVASGEVRFSTDASGPTEDFFVLEKEIATELVEGLAITITAREKVALQQAATTSLDAAIKYGQALQAIDLGHVDEARARLAEALAADDGFAAARTLLGQYKAEVAAGSASYSTVVAGQFRDGEALIARCEGGDCADLALFVTKLPGSDFEPPERALRQAFVRKVLASKIPADTRLVMGEMKGPLTVELAMVWLASSCMTGEDYGCTIATGREFMAKYPSSEWFRTMSSLTESAIGVLEGQTRAPR